MKKTLLIIAILASIMQSKADGYQIMNASFTATDSVAKGSYQTVDIKLVSSAGGNKTLFLIYGTHLTETPTISYASLPLQPDGSRRFGFYLPSDWGGVFTVQVYFGTKRTGLAKKSSGTNTVSGVSTVPGTTSGINTVPGVTTTTGNQTVSGTNTVTGTNTISGTNTVSGTNSVTGISDDLVEDVPIIVEYYDLNGNLIAFPVGIAIKVEFFRSGQARKSKICIVNP